MFFVTENTPEKMLRNSVVLTVPGWIKIHLVYSGYIDQTLLKGDYVTPYFPYYGWTLI